VTEHAVEVSVVVPIKDERESLAELGARIVETLRGERRSFEVILIDDGSEDGSWDEILELCATYEEIRALRQRRNFGKAAALAAGFSAAGGDVVITMDGDLQDDPAEIPRFLDAIGRGYDAVSGWKRVRHDPISKRLPSRLFNAALRRVCGLPLHDFNCGFKAYTAQTAAALQPYVYGELHRYLAALLAAQGFRIGEIEVRHRARRYGSSKYGCRRMIAGACDLLTVLLLTRFRYRPLHAFAGLAAAALALGLALAAGLVLAGREELGAGTFVLVCAGVVALIGAGLACELLVSSIGPAESRSGVAQAVGIGTATTPAIALRSRMTGASRHAADGALAERGSRR
jgi:hypothetical protein